MKIEAADTPEIDDASVKEKTGKALAQWFAALDALERHVENAG